MQQQTPTDISRPSTTSATAAEKIQIPYFSCRLSQQACADCSKTAYLKRRATASKMPPFSVSPAGSPGPTVLLADVEDTLVGCRELDIPSEVLEVVCGRSPPLGRTPTRHFGTSGPYRTSPVEATGAKCVTNLAMVEVVSVVSRGAAVVEW